MNNRFLVWRYKAADRAVVLQDFKGLKDKFPLHDGVAQLPNFPSDAAFYMNPDFQDHQLFQDCLLNSDMCVIVSERLKTAIEKLAPPQVELLPVGIYNLKKQLIKERYFILHPVNPVDCIDREASGAQMDDIVDPEAIESVKKLVLDESRIPKDRTVFRLKNFWGVIVVRDDFAQALNKEGFTGVRWLEPQHFPEP